MKFGWAREECFLNFVCSSIISSYFSSFASSIWSSEWAARSPEKAVATPLKIIMKFEWAREERFLILVRSSIISSHFSSFSSSWSSEWVARPPKKAVASYSTENNHDIWVGKRETFPHFCSFFYYFLPFFFIFFFNLVLGMGGSPGGALT